jgi:hypothetical protein
MEPTDYCAHARIEGDNYRMKCLDCGEEEEYD